MDYNRYTNLEEDSLQEGNRTLVTSGVYSSKMKSFKDKVFGRFQEENTSRNGIEVITINELAELVTGALEDNNNQKEKCASKRIYLNKSHLTASPFVQNPKKNEANDEEENVQQAKGQYEHFNVFEDYQFIQCLNDFKSPSGMRTRHGYFERLSN